MLLLVILCLITVQYSTGQLTAHNCEKPGVPKAFDMGLSVNCTSEYLAKIKGKSIGGSIIQMTAQTRTKAIGCSMRQIQKNIYCSYEREKVDVMGHRSVPPWEMIPVSGTTCKNWIDSSVVTGPFKSFPLTIGALVRADSKSNSNNGGFCNNWSEWVSETLYEILVENTELVTLRHPTGEIHRHQDDGEDTVHASGLDRGISTLGVGMVWDPLSIKECPWRSLYKGNLTLITQDNKNVGVTAIDLKAGYRLKQNAAVCGLMVTKTTDPYIFVVEDTTLSYSPPSPKETNIIMGALRGGVNYLSLHVGMELDKLAEVAMNNICRVEQSIRIESLYSSKEEPEELGFRMMNRRGYRAVVAGEAILVSSCETVNVQLYPQEECFDLIPVIRGANKPLEFLNPVTRTLTNASSQLDCDDDAVPLINIKSTWYKLSPSLTEVVVRSDMSMTEMYGFEAQLGGTRLVYKDDTMSAVEARPSYNERKRKARQKTDNFIDPECGLDTQGPSYDEMVHQLEGSILGHTLHIPFTIIIFVVFGILHLVTCMRLSRVPHSHDGSTSVTIKNTNAGENQVFNIDPDEIKALFEKVDV